MMEIPKRIKILKKKMGMTLEAVSQKSGVPQGTINKIAAGQTKKPSRKTMEKIAEAFGVDVDYFYNEVLPFEDEDLMVPPDQEQEKDLYRILARVMEAKQISYYQLSMMTGIDPVELHNMVQWRDKETSTSNAVKLARGLGLTLEQISGIAPIDYTALTPIDNNQSPEQRLYGLLRSNGFITNIDSPTPEQMKFINGFCVGVDLIFNK